MKSKRATWALLALALVVVIGATLVTPAQAQDPIGGALATLAAATARAEQVRAAQRATAAALSAQATSQAIVAQATARAMSAEATMQAQAVSAHATQSAVDELNRQRAAAATVERMNLDATRQAQQAAATLQAGNVAAQATANAVSLARDTQLARTYATRQERFTFGLLLVEIFFVCGAAWVLWKLARTLSAWADRLRPQAEPTFAGVIGATAQPAARVVIDAAPTPKTPQAEARMPDLVQVVDNPQMVDALERWAERFDAEKGLTYGDN